MTVIRLLITVLLLCLLASMSVSCFGGAGSTGVGWFSDDNTKDTITFRFNAQSTGNPVTIDNNGSLQQDLSGQFELVDINARTTINGIFDTTYAIQPNINNSIIFTGRCTVNKNGIHNFLIGFIDKGGTGLNPGDKISVWIDPDSSNYLPTYTGTIAGGKIEIRR